MNDFTPPPSSKWARRLLAAQPGDSFTLLNPEEYKTVWAAAKRWKIKIAKRDNVIWVL